MTPEEIRALDAGHAFSDASGDHPWRGAGVRSPTLEELLDTFPDTPMVIEMKLEGVATPSRSWRPGGRRPAGPTT